MAWVKEASGASGASVNSCTVTVPTGGFPVGHLLVLGVMTTTAGGGVFSVTDTAGNTWQQEYSVIISAASTGGACQFSCIVSSNLAAGATITVAVTGGSLSRWAVSVQEFDDSITARDTGASSDNGGANSAVVTSGSFTTTTANTLIIGTLGLVSSGRIFTPGSGYTVGTKIISTGASGNRAVVAQWKYVSTAASYVSNGSLDSASYYAMAARAYVIGGTPPARSGNAKVWDGSAWVAHPAKVWDGSAWVAHKAKGYNGSTWIEGK